MSAENVELVQAAFAEFATRGEPNWELLDPQIQTRDHDVMDADEYSGHEGHGRWLEDWAQAWSDFSLGPAEELIDAGEDVVLVYRLKATGRASGVTIERQDAIVCRVERGLITRLDYYNSRAQALAHVGLER
jgi:ketosteroid isomerase-like protein